MDTTAKRFPIGIPQPSIETEEKYQLPQRNAPYAESEWKIVNQMRAIKQHLGLGTIVGAVSLVVSLLTIAFLIGSPIVSQAGKNEASATNLGNLDRSVNELKVAAKENKEESAKALADAVAEIKSMVGRSLDLAQQNREDVRALRESNDRQFIALKDKTDSLWNWMGQLNNKIVTVEADMKIQNAKKP